MKLNDEIPLGIYVKVKKGLDPAKSEYGIKINGDMAKSYGKIYRVEKCHLTMDHKMALLRLYDVQERHMSLWTWTPLMLEFPTNEEIGKVM